VSPLYGKVAYFQEHIYHYDVYGLIGPAFVMSEQSQTIGAVIGIGVRIFHNRWFTIKFEFRDYLYFEKRMDFPPTGSAPPTIAGKVFTNSFILSLGWSLFFPKFQYNPLE